MNKVQVSVTPEQVPSGNSFFFMFTVAFHLYVFLGTTISMIMLMPQVYMLLKQKKLRGLVGAINHVQTGHKGLSHSHWLASYQGNLS